MAGEEPAGDETAGEEYDRVWRPALGARTVSWVIALVAGLLAVSALATAVGGGIPVGGALVVVAVNVVVALAAWRWGSYPLVAASGAGLTVRNPLQTTVIPWDDITGARASSLGLTVGRASGEPVVAWAVTRSALSGWLDRPSRADEVIAYLAARVFGEGEGSGAVGAPGDGRGDGGNGEHPDHDADGEQGREGA